MSSIKEEKTMNIRFHIPVSVYAKVKRVQGLLQSKTDSPVTMVETYTRLMDQGATAILKNNR